MFQKEYNRFKKSVDKAVMDFLGCTSDEAVSIDAKISGNYVNFNDDADIKPFMTSTEYRMKTATLHYFADVIRGLKNLQASLGSDFPGDEK